MWTTSSKTIVIFAILSIAAAANISLEDLLKIDPEALLQPLEITEEQKRNLIDCLGETSTGVDCPDLPLTEALQQLRDLIIKTKNASSDRGILGVLDQTIGSIKNLTEKVVDTGSEIITKTTKKADELLDLFEKVKSTYENDNKGLPEDPFQDISDYSTSKDSINVKADVAGALKTRKSLRDTFASTSDFILYKYGSKYHPLILSVKVVGFIRMLLEAF